MTITNELFEAQLTENNKVINYILNRYRGAIPSEELKQCGHLGLWKALQKHNPSFKTKFTTSICRYVRWECLKSLVKRRGEEQLDGDEVQSGQDRQSRKARRKLGQIFKRLSGKYVDLLSLRYLKGYSVNELAELKGCSESKIRYVLKEALKRAAAVY